MSYIALSSPSAGIDSERDGLTGNARGDGQCGVEEDVLYCCHGEDDSCETCIDDS